MAYSLSLLFLLPLLATSSPLKKRQGGSASESTRAASYVGLSTSNIFPPSNTVPNTALFPLESVVGFPGPTPTGVEPNLIATGTAYPENTDPFYPLPKNQASGQAASDPFDSRKYWGNLSPQYSVPSSFYGLESASPLIPDQCSITQVHILYRHGARYPTSDAAPATFAAKLHNATSGSGFQATGDAAFLNTWTYKLGAELLTPFGRKQEFELGIGFRQFYGELLNNFTAAGTLPVFRTESQDRMVKTAINFAAGMFGVPEYQDQVSIEIVPETKGINNTGAPYEICTNSNVPSRGSIGTAAATNFTKTAYAPTVARIQPLINGVNITTADIQAMLQLCSYEVVALGASKFCSLFTEEDFKNYEYAYDISFYYNQGFGSPVSAAQGKGYLEEFVARLQQQPLSAYNSTTNSSFDSNPALFPLNQSIYADATHEVVVLDTLSALNLSSIFSSGPPSITERTNNSFVASQVVPFATHLVLQVLECSNKMPTKQIRFILNDAVLPLAYAGCPKDEDGLCAFDTVLSALEKRVQEIDFDYDCFGNYTATAGIDYNGRAPRS